MAAPHVAGAWAILEQWDAGQDVALILSRLQNMGTPVADTRPGGTVTARRINIADTAGVRPLNDGFGFWQGLGNTATFSIKGINGAATRESGEPDHLPVSSSLGENSVWYGWTAPASGQVTMNTCTSSFDTAIAVYTGGSTFSSLTQAARDDDSCTAPNNEKGSRLTFDVAAGTFYRIAVAGSSSQQEGTFTLGLAYASPSNDDLADAQLISGPSNSINSIIGANAGATREPGEPDHLPADSSLGEHSVWYDWTALRTGRVNVDTCSAFDTTFDTVLAVYTGGSFPSLTQVASNDDGACPNNTQSKLAFDATAGTNYRIAVSGFSASNGEGRFMLHVGDATPPNDNFADALSISGAPASTDGINVGATTEQGEPDHLPDSSSIGERSVWYNWTAPRTGRVNMDTCTSDFDTALAAYTGSSIGSLSQLASNDTRDPDSLQRVCDGPNIDGSRVSFDVVEGTTYRIAVSGFNFSQGTFTLKTAYAPLPNDNFADAQSVSGTSASTGGTNVGATREPGEPDHLPAGGSLGEHSVWYDWTAPRTGQVTMDTCTSNLDTVLAVYTGASVGSLNQVASDDDACTSPNNSGSRVSFDATAGITYRIAVSGFSLHSSQNTFTLGLDSALVKADYQLVNSRASSVGTAPALTDIGPGTNTFASATVDGTPTTVLTFPRENGVRLSPTTGVVQNSTYTIVALFELDEADRWRRILDFKNGVGDNGLYFDGGNKLNFFGAQSSGGTTVPANTWVQVALTRNTSGTVVGYVNGIQQFSFADSSNNAVIDANNALRFFKDNDTVGATAEESAGSVARIRLYDGALTANQVGALDRLDTTPPAVTKVTPANNATNIAPTANVTATFSESMRAGSINANTVKLKKAGTTATIPATVTYSASIRRAVLNPSANLVSGAKYIATVTTGAKDSAGNSLDQNLSLAGNQAKTWRFTVN